MLLFKVRIIERTILTFLLIQFPPINFLLLPYACHAEQQLGFSLELDTPASLVRNRAKYLPTTIMQDIRNPLVAIGRGLRVRK